MALPRIYADFQNLDDENRLRLTCAGTRRDLERQGLELSEGMNLALYTDDATDDGQADELLAEGVVHFHEAENCWVAAIDWQGIRHASMNREPSTAAKNGDEKPMVESTAPKIFISYSWTDESHKQWVLDLATRLRHDGGTNVILDRWHLKEGHDKYKFMEQMVTDRDVAKVLLVCDKAYMDKANARKGGVGDESLIISPEIYRSAEQEKFIPLLRQREDGKECLPAFCGDRKYIDFCDDAQFEEAYDTLIRLIHGQPELKLPPIGPPPKHIFQNKVQVKTAGKFARLKDAAEKNKPHVQVYLQEYLEAFLEAMEDFRIPHTGRISETFDDEVVQNVQDFLPYRDNLIDAFFVVAKFTNNEEAYDHVFDFLEKLLAFQFRPDGMNSWNRESFDNYHFLIYEIALYFIAVMAKTKRYAVIRRFFESTYLVRSESTQKEGHDSSTFNFDSISLNETRNKRLELNRASVVADMISTRPYPSIKIPDLVQADFLGFFQSCTIRDNPYRKWWPHCLVYGQNIGSLEIFGKITSPQGLKAPQALYGVSTLNDFYDRLKTFLKSNLFQAYNQHRFMSRIPFDQLLNISEIERALG